MINNQKNCKWKEGLGYPMFNSISWEDLIATSNRGVREYVVMVNLRSLGGW